MSDTIKTRPQTAEFDEGYERTFGKDRKPTRGRWVATPSGLVPADEYVRPESTDALHAPVMVDRYMEGTVAPDGSDIGNRTRRKQWMAATGSADYGDFKEHRKRAQAEREARQRGEFKKDPALREFIGRELYKRKLIT